MSGSSSGPSSAEPSPSPPVAVIGAGVMGAGIAQALAATAGLPVRLYDVSEAQLRNALHEIEHGRFGLRRGVERGRLTADQANAALARIDAVTGLDAACAGVQAVVEAVPEDLGLKCRLFQEMDALVPLDAILTSNTAGLPITALAWATRRPERVVGWHWAQPAPVMRLAEIIAHPGTSAETTEQVCRLAALCGKNPVVIKDQPQAWGFVANRINRAVRLEARRVVEEGVATEEQVDTIMKDCFRWPMGPFETMGMGRKN